MSARARRQRIEGMVVEAHERLVEHVSAQEGLAVVEAPPGSGKTYLLLKLAAHAWREGQPVAIAAQTNAQADDICRRLHEERDGIPVTRFASRAYSVPEEIEEAIHIVRSAAELADAPGVVVSTTEKWGLSDLVAPYGLLLVDEAWQMTWASFMPLGDVAERFVLIGDPGQIAPVVTIGTERWETSPSAPHRAAPQVLIERGGNFLRVALPSTRRLPYETAQLIQPFYDFEFDSYAGRGERGLLVESGSGDAIDSALAELGEASIGSLLLPTPAEGVPSGRDTDLARLAARVVERLMDGGAQYRIGRKRLSLRVEDIGICATHRVMVSEIELSLQAKYRGRVRVDTPERWQGLECKIMIAVHPLSGVARPSSFDLDTGRLCVMASRHQVGLLVVGRDHIESTLDEHIPVADHPVGRPDVAGRGHDRHLEFWRAIAGGASVTTPSLVAPGKGLV